MSMKQSRHYDDPPFWLDDHPDRFPLRRVDFAAHGWKVVKDIVLDGMWGIALFEPFQDDGTPAVRGCVSDGFYLEYPIWRWDRETRWKNPHIIPRKVKKSFADACMALSKARP